MSTWASLLNGFDVYPLVFNAVSMSNMINATFTDRLPQSFYIGMLGQIFDLFYFTLYALASSAFILTVMFALWYIIIDPFLVRLGTLWRK